MIICLAIKNKTYCLCISLGQQSLQLLLIDYSVSFQKGFWHPWCAYWASLIKNLYWSTMATVQCHTRPKSQHLYVAELELSTGLPQHKQQQVIILLPQWGLISYCKKRKLLNSPNQPHNGNQAGGCHTLKEGAFPIPSGRGGLIYNLRLCWDQWQSIAWPHVKRPVSERVSVVGWQLH